MYFINFIHFKRLLKFLRQAFSTAQNQKSYGVKVMLTLYYLRKKLSGGSVKTIRRGKNYKGASADGRRRKIYAAAEHLSRVGTEGPKLQIFFSKKSHVCRKLPHSAKNTLFHMLIHCGTVPYPYTLPKTRS